MLDKAIEHGHEHRRKYRGAKSIDKTCRNHGTCKWCKGNRTINAKRRKAKADDDMRTVLFALDVL